jgi:hypothetical protein
MKGKKYCTKCFVVSKKLSVCFYGLAKYNFEESVYCTVAPWATSESLCDNLLASQGRTEIQNRLHYYKIGSKVIKYVINLSRSITLRSSSGYLYVLFNFTHQKKRHFPV